MNDIENTFPFVEGGFMMERFSWREECGGCSLHILLFVCLGFIGAMEEFTASMAWSDRLGGDE